jgi:predicted MPP superfamily phosphohydrolase
VRATVPEVLRDLAEQLRMTTPAQWQRERLVFALGLATMACLSWGFVEPYWVEVTEHRIASPKLRPDTRIRVVHLSDIHSDAKEQLEPKIVAIVAKLRPDLILFTGDAMNEAEGLQSFALP